MKLDIFTKNYAGLLAVPPLLRHRAKPAKLVESVRKKGVSSQVKSSASSRPAHPVYVVPSHKSPATPAPLDMPPRIAAQNRSQGP